MRTSILALVVLFVGLVGAACSAQETTTHSNMDTQFFERNSSKLAELALLFLSDRLDHPTLSHIATERLWTSLASHLLGKETFPVTT
jgi:hypothetical protein